MITVLATNAYKAAYKVRKAIQKCDLPVSDCILIRTHEGRLMLTPFRFEEREKHSEYVPARIETEFATCIPAKPFVDWLRVTQNKQPKTPRPTYRNGYAKPEWVDDRIELTFDPQVQIVRIRAGNTRAEFKCIDAQEFPPC